MRPTFRIGNKGVGGDSPCFIIAEIGINHNNDLDIAKRLIDAAAEAGCNAVKLQTFKAERLFNKQAGEVEFNKGTYQIFEVNKRFELPLGWIPELMAHARRRKIEIFSSVCDEASADALSKLKMPALKLTSTAITHLPLQEHVARLGVPVIASCGASDIGEVNEAYKTITAHNECLALLHCIVSYPHGLEYTNAEVIETMRRAFPKAIIGFSDHSTHPTKAPIAAVALGAKLLEKHITLDKGMEGPDHFFALEPHELKAMVQAVRKTEHRVKAGERIDVPAKLRGSPEKQVYDVEEYSKRFSNRSIFATRDLKAKERITASKISVLRPGNMPLGIEPRYYRMLITKRPRLTKAVKANHPITWDALLAR